MEKSVLRHYRHIRVPETGPFQLNAASAARLEIFHTNGVVPRAQGYFRFFGFHAVPAVVVDEFAAIDEEPAAIVAAELEQDVVVFVQKQKSFRCHREIIAQRRKIGAFRIQAGGNGRERGFGVETNVLQCEWGRGEVEYLNGQTGNHFFVDHGSVGP